MKDQIALLVSKAIGIDKSEIISLIEIPPSEDLGDFALPCFLFAKSQKKSPVDIAKTIVDKIKESNDFEKIEAKGPYVNFYVNRANLVRETIANILKLQKNYGKSDIGKGKTVVIDLSSPNIAKPFGIGHLRSTIIGNSIGKIAEKLGYKVIKINYLGDWGTQFGKLIVGYKNFGDAKKLKKDPINHLYELYVKANDEKYEEEARIWFKKLEDGDKEALKLWKTFKDLSIKEFNKLYKLMEIEFDFIEGESFYNEKMKDTLELLEKKKLLVKSEGAEGVDLEKEGLGFCLIKKADGATLYATRDITAAIDRYNRFKFDKMIYEVGQEQRLHFNQFFKVLDLMGNDWSKNCEHVYHGLYLGQDGKKFATRKGKTIFMEDVFNETIQLASEEVKKREDISDTEVKKRAKAIAISAIFYGDLKSFRANDIIFDIDKFISFEGNTGPYLLYTYARSKSILAKSKKSKAKAVKVTDIEKSLISKLGEFPSVVNRSYESLSPNLVANYAFEISQKFNEFYHSEQVIGSENEAFKLSIVEAFSIVLQNSLNLLGIKTLEKM